MSSPEIRHSDYCGAVPRLGSIVLASVLLGVPRAVDARAFGVQRSVYVDVAPQAPVLLSLATELKRAIGVGAYTLDPRPSESAFVIGLLNVSRSAAADGRSMEAAAFSLRDGRKARHGSGALLRRLLEAGAPHVIHAAGP